MRTIKLSQPDAWRQMPLAGPMRSWLTYRGSLTSRIIEHFAHFNLVRLSQHLGHPNRDEHRALALRRGELAVIREVLLRDGSTPLVFAHTAANPRDLRGAWRGLSRLGSRPLAEMLFQDPTVVRKPMEYRQLRSTHPLALSVQQRQLPSHNLWARRSVFLKAGRPLLVTEVFLPVIITCS
jgi:chorismate lyase